MATAPVPGAQRRQENATRFFRITLFDQTLELPADCPLGEKMAVRQATGFPYEAFVPSADAKQFGEDSVAVLWWLARRANGEPRLPWQEVMSTWRTLGEKDLEFDVVEDDGLPSGDPGKSGPD